MDSEEGGLWNLRAEEGPAKDCVLMRNKGWGGGRRADSEGVWLGGGWNAFAAKRIRDADMSLVLRLGGVARRATLETRGGQIDSQRLMEQGSSL